jgi:pimeloyl-ACP methyl ester carboxylesterase
VTRLPQQEYSIEGFAEDLVWLCAQQQITKAVIVGQSMGGNMALEIAARYLLLFLLFIFCFERTGSGATPPAPRQRGGRAAVGGSSP